MSEYKIELLKLDKRRLKLQKEYGPFWSELQNDYPFLIPHSPLPPGYPEGSVRNEQTDSVQSPVKQVMLVPAQDQNEQTDSVSVPAEQVAIVFVPD